MHDFKREKNKVSSSVNFLKESRPRSSTMWPSVWKTQMSAVCCSTLNKMDLCLQARVDKFPLFQKNTDDCDDPKRRRGVGGVAQDTWLKVALKGVMHSVERIVRSHHFLTLEWSDKSERTTWCARAGQSHFFLTVVETLQSKYIKRFFFIL